MTDTPLLRAALAETVTTAQATDGTDHIAEQMADELIAALGPKADAIEGMLSDLDTFGLACQTRLATGSIARVDPRQVRLYPGAPND